MKAMYRKNDAATSIAAAESIKPQLNDLQQRILAAIRRWEFNHGHGPTDKELERLPEFVNCGPSTVRRRRTDLLKLGLIRPTGRVRNRCQEWEAIPDRERAEQATADRGGRLF